MWHIYRQLCGLQNFRPVVFAHKRENPGLFPYPEEQFVTVPRPLTRELRRFWYRNMQRLPVQVYRGEARRLALRFDAAQAQLGHIYFGHVGVYLLPLWEFWPKPLIVSFHGADAGVDLGTERVRNLYRRVFASATLILARSEALRADLIALGADPAKVRLNRTSIPVRDFPFAVRKPPPQGAWHFLQACRLIPKKGLDLTLRVFADFTENHPQARLTIAGEGPELETLESLARELGVREQVHFAGFLDQDQLRKAYAAAHIFLHPSRVTEEGDREGVPNSLLEAMASGLPVLATCHGGIPEAVTPDRSGMLVGENDFDGLRSALSKLTENADLLQSLSRGAREEVAEKFDQASQIATLENAYDWVLSQR